MQYNLYCISWKLEIRRVKRLPGRDLRQTAWESEILENPFMLHYQHNSGVTSRKTFISTTNKHHVACLKNKINESSWLQIYEFQPRRSEWKRREGFRDYVKCSVIFFEHVATW